jgi:hypothetical protein
MVADESVIMTYVGVEEVSMWTLVCQERAAHLKRGDEG